MKTYKGNVDITEANQKKWGRKLKNVEKISGDIWVHSDARLDAGKLESVGGDIEINKTAKVSENIIVLQVAKVL